MLEQGLYFREALAAVLYVVCECVARNVQSTADLEQHARVAILNVDINVVLPTGCPANLTAYHAEGLALPRLNPPELVLGPFVSYFGGVILDFLCPFHEVCLLWQTILLHFPLFPSLAKETGLPQLLQNVSIDSLAELKLFENA